MGGSGISSAAVSTSSAATENLLFTVRQQPNPFFTVYNTDFNIVRQFSIGNCSQSTDFRQAPGVVASTPRYGSVAAVYLDAMNGTTAVVLSTNGTELRYFPLFPAASLGSEVPRLRVGTGLSSKITHITAGNTLVVSATVANTDAPLSYIAHRKMGTDPFNFTAVNAQDVCAASSSHINHFYMSKSRRFAVYSQAPAIAGDRFLLGTANFTTQSVNLSSLDDNGSRLSWWEEDLMFCSPEELPVMFYPLGDVGVYSRSEIQASRLSYRTYAPSGAKSEVPALRQATGPRAISFASPYHADPTLASFYIYLGNLSKLYAVNSSGAFTDISTSPQSERFISHLGAVLGYFDKTSQTGIRNYRVFFNSSSSVASSVAVRLTRSVQWISTKQGQPSPGFVALTTLNSTDPQIPPSSIEAIEYWAVSQSISSVADRTLQLGLVLLNDSRAIPTLCAAWTAGALILLPRDDAVDVLYWKYSGSGFQTVATILRSAIPTCSSLRAYATQLPSFFALNIS